jgi:hypothetical protein
MQLAGRCRPGRRLRFRVNRAVSLERPFGSSPSSEAQVRASSAVGVGTTALVGKGHSRAGRLLLVPSERAGRGAEDGRIQAESSSAGATAPHDDESVEAHGREN